MDTVAPTPSVENGPFTASRRLVAAEQLGVMCLLDNANGRSRALESLRSDAGTALLWPGRSTASSEPVAAWITDNAGEPIPIFAVVTEDGAAERLLARHGGTWTRVRAVTAADGDRLGSIWRERDGSVFVPFDPDEICETYWSERYLELVGGHGGSRARRHLMHAYYGVRGVLPRPTQIWLRRHYSRVQARTTFPRWPAEPGLHDFLDLFAALLAEVAGTPLPRIAAWPNGHRWAVVLTHDVETERGLAAVEPVLELERSLGLRSCWNFVPERYRVDDRRIEELVRDGFEVGVHGLRHDGRDLQSLARVHQRLPAMRAAAARWRATGFRAPAMHRNWEWMPLLGFDYDSSYPDSDPYEPQSGGCCSWLPFFNRDLVELPLTMPQDHTLFEILRHEDETAWLEKARLLRARGGMALLVTHPDYLVKPHIMNAYRRLIEQLAADETAWHALPSEVATWWRRRAASAVHRHGGSWRPAGPAAEEATVELVGAACQW
jgi:hypothetical protein